MKRAAHNKLTRSQVIECFHRVHGDTYDYSLFEYFDARTKSTIVCRKHGPWEISADNHKRGRCCPVCRDENNSKQQSLTQKEFIAKCISIHGGRYILSKVQYVNAKTPILVGCRNHGFFKTLPINFAWHGKGCLYCSRQKMGIDDIT